MDKSIITSLTAEILFSRFLGFLFRVIINSAVLCWTRSWQLWTLQKGACSPGWSHLHVSCCVSWHPRPMEGNRKEPAEILICGTLFWCHHHRLSGSTDGVSTQQPSHPYTYIVTVIFYTHRVLVFLKILYILHVIYKDRNVTVLIYKICLDTISYLMI